MADTKNDMHVYGIIHFYTNIAIEIATPRGRIIIKVSAEEKNGFTKGLHWLILRQNRDGSWGETSGQDIDRLVTTCQVTTLLLDAGCSMTSKPVSQAKAFLLDKKWGDYSVGNVTSYWRIEPFSRMAAEDTKVLDACKVELTELLRSVQEGKSPSHSFTLTLFAIKCIHLLNEQGDRSKITFLIEKAITSSWRDSATCFGDRADMASLATTWLVRDAWPPTVAGQRKTILNACKEYLIAKATTNESGKSWEAGHILRTAYVCINTAEALQPDPNLVSQMESVSKFLLALQNKQGFRQIRHGERSPVIKSREYFTAVVLRGLLASAKLQRNDLIVETWATQGLSYWDFLARFTGLSTVLIVLMFIYFGFNLWEILKISHYLENPKIALYANYLLGVLGAFGFFQFLFVLWKKRN